LAPLHQLALDWTIINDTYWYITLFTYYKIDSTDETFEILVLHSNAEYRRTVTWHQSAKPTASYRYEYVEAALIKIDLSVFQSWQNDDEVYNSTGTVS